MLRTLKCQSWVLSPVYTSIFLFKIYNEVWKLPIMKYPTSISIRNRCYLRTNCGSRGIHGWLPKKKECRIIKGCSGSKHNMPSIYPILSDSHINLALSLSLSPTHAQTHTYRHTHNISFKCACRNKINIHQLTNHKPMISHFLKKCITTLALHFFLSNGTLKVQIKLHIWKITNTQSCQ